MLQCWRAVAVAQGQSTRLWLWGLGVQIPSATPSRWFAPCGDSIPGWGQQQAEVARRRRRGFPMVDEERLVMTGVQVEFDRRAGRWVAACDDPGGEERLVVNAETLERAERLLDERWRARLELLDHEGEEDR